MVFIFIILTLIAGTLARLFAIDGFKVLAIDNDSAMNLSYTLGISDAVKSKLVPIPTTLTISRISDAVYHVGWRMDLNK